MNLTAKRLLIAALAGMLLISGMTACGSKKETPEYDTGSRVLYSDSDTETETDEEEESTEDTEETSSKEEKKVVTTDSDKKTSSKSSSSKASSKTTSKAASSKAASSKASSSKAAASKAASSTYRQSEASSAAASGKDETSSAATSSEVSTDTSTAADTDTSEIQFDTETDSASTGSFDENADLSFTYGSYEIVLEADINDVIENLGDDYTRESTPSCLYPSLEDASYDYGDIVINTFPTADGEGEIVSGIELKSTAVATDGKDIKIGDSLEDVLAAYGEDYSLLGTSSYRYVSADGKYFLSFFIVDDTVESITIAIDSKNY